MAGGSKDQPTGRVLLITDRLLHSVESPVSFSNFVKRIRVANTCDPSFFDYSWQRLYNNGLTRVYESRSTGIHNFDLEAFITGQTIFLPGLQQQRKIASILSTVDDHIQKTQQIIDKTEGLKKGLMQQLLTRGIGHTRFKKTEIGEIPEEWGAAKLGDLWTFIKAGISRPFESEDIGIPVLRSNNVRTGRIDLADLKYWYNPDPRGANLASITLKKFDILVNFVNGSLKELGKAAIYLEEISPCIVSTNFFILRFKPHVDPFYINLFLQTNAYKKQIDAIGGFTGQGSFDTGELRQVMLPLPPLPEQRKIVDLIHAVDSKTSRERLRSHQLEHLKKGLMQVLLTGKVRVKVPA